MSIKTERLIIRKFELEDWQSVFKYTSDTNVMEYIPEGVLTEEGAKHFINKNIGEKAENFPVKIGMRREGYFKKCIPKGNEWWDEYYYAILEEEWKEY